jgi:hypothetical protein
MRNARDQKVNGTGACCMGISKLLGTFLKEDAWIFLLKKSKEEDHMGGFSQRS